MRILCRSSGLSGYEGAVTWELVNHGMPIECVEADAPLNFYFGKDTNSVLRRIFLDHDIVFPDSPVADFEGMGDRKIITPSDLVNFCSNNSFLDDTISDSETFYSEVA